MRPLHLFQANHSCFFCLKFCLQLWPNNVLKPLGRNCHVVAVRVHLDQLEVSSVKIPVKKVVIEFQHPQLCQLIDCDSDLEGASDCDPWLSDFQLVRLPDPVYITEIGTSQGSVNDLLVFGVDHVRLPLQSFDELPVLAVSQQFEHLSKQRLALFNVSRTASLCYLLHKPVEDLIGGIFDRSIDSRDHAL